MNTCFLNMLLDGGNNAQGNCFRYDPAANSWTALASMPVRWAHASAAFDGKIYVFGGYGINSSAHVTSTYVYDIAANSWSAGSTMPTWRASMQAREVGGKIYVMGGNLQGPLSAITEAYDPAANAWASLAPMPTARSNYAAVVDNGRIYVMGGEMGGSTNTCVQYDAQANSWLPTNPMNQPRQNFALGLINGKAYAGQGFGTAQLANTEEYTMPKTVYLVEKI